MLHVCPPLVISSRCLLFHSKHLFTHFAQQVVAR